MDYARHRREISRLLDYRAGSEAQSSHRPAVERACERQEHRPLRVPPGHLSEGLDALSAAPAQEHLLLEVPGSDLVQLLPELHSVPVVEVRVRVVQQPLGLLTYGLHHLWVAVTNVHSPETRVEVDVFVPVHILDYGAMTLLRNHRIVVWPVVWGQNRAIALHPHLRFRSGELTHSFQRNLCLSIGVQYTPLGLLV